MSKPNLVLIKGGNGGGYPKAQTLIPRPEDDGVCATSLQDASRRKIEDELSRGVNLNLETEEAGTWIMRMLASDKIKSPRELVMRALRFYEWYLGEKKEGNEICFKDGDEIIQCDFDFSSEEKSKSLEDQPPKNNENEIDNVVVPINSLLAQRFFGEPIVLAFGREDRQTIINMIKMSGDGNFGRLLINSLRLYEWYTELLKSPKPELYLWGERGMFMVDIDFEA